MNPSYKAPKQVRYDSKVYKVHNGHRNILHTIHLLNDPKIDDIERAKIIVCKIFGVDMPIVQKTVDKALEILNNGKTEVKQLKSTQQSMDLWQDYSVYRMDIIREYGVDIDKVSVEWGDLLDMIANLSADSQLNNYSKIRTQSLKEIKDPKERKKFKEVQESIKIIKQDEPIDVHEGESIFDKARRVQGQKRKENDLLHKEK